jgi:poly(A) polymerase
MSALLRLHARQIVERLTQAGHPALFAGGCVRDMLRGEDPHDIDIATDATPEEVQALFERTVTVGSRFGVVVVLLGDHPFEVATFRTDAAYTDGRHPDAVEFADARADAQRRDFTINGLFFDPLAEKVVDYVGGQADLQAGILRAIGDPHQRFAEDALRLLRAVRFAVRFDYRIEPATLAALRAHAADIQRVSAERVRDELLRILTGPRRGQALDLLHATGLLGAILPEVADLAGCTQPPEFHPEGDVLTHTRLALDALGDAVSPEEKSITNDTRERVPRMQSPSPELAFAVLLHDVGKPPTRTEAEGDRIRFNLHHRVGEHLTRAICERLRFSSDQTDHIVELVNDHMKFCSVADMRESTLKRFLRSPHILDLLELHRVDCVASHGDLRNYALCRQKLETLSQEDIRPPRLLTGDDLLDLGYAPGPLFGTILTRVEDAQLEGQVASRDDALALIRSEFPRGRDIRR